METGLLASVPGVLQAANGAPVMGGRAQGTAYARAAWADGRVSAMALSSHKIGGPDRGGGALWSERAILSWRLSRRPAGARAARRDGGGHRGGRLCPRAHGYPLRPGQLAALTARFEPR